ncbi:MAG: hypothetical protein R3F59_07055 [Myxococcota bacterium]
MLVLILVVAVGAVLAWQLVDVRMVDDGEMPTVQVDRGKLPTFDVDVGKVKIEKQAREVDVPKVTTEPRTVEFPVVDVEQPADR